MNLAINNINVDENVTINGKRDQKLKKNATAAKTKLKSKRVALDELQNDAGPRVVIAQDTVHEDIKAGRRNLAKPRVDTHWKKGELVSNDAATIKQVFGRFLRPTKTNTLTTDRVTRRREENGCDAKAVTVKLVENKTQQAKYIRKDKIYPNVTKLRCEDGNSPLRSEPNATLLADSKKMTDSTNNINGIAISTKASDNTNVQAFKAKASLNSPETIDIEENQLTAIESAPNTKHTIIAIESATTLCDIKCEEYNGKPASSISPADIVTDIDKEYGNSLILVPEYVNDIYDYYFMLESQQKVRTDHLSKQEAISPKMRAILLDWLNEAHEQCHLSNETYHMSVGIIDRYLQKVENTDRSMLQLVGVTSLLLAAKYEDVYPPSMNDIIYMTDDVYTAKHVIQMEMKIFRTLDYNLSRPVSLHFLRRFSKAASADVLLHTMSKYFLELATISYDLASCKPSKIAAASLFLSLHLVKYDLAKETGFDNGLWDKTLQYYSRYVPSQLQPISKKIAVLARNAKTAQLNAIYSKYGKTKYYKVASRPELYSPLMDSIIKSEQELY